MRKQVIHVVDPINTVWFVNVYTTYLKYIEKLINYKNCVNKEEECR